LKVAHNSLVALLASGHIHHIISQNVDGLHLRSGLTPSSLTELHGNIFMEQCTGCKREYFRTYDIGGMGLKLTGNICSEGQDGSSTFDGTIVFDSNHSTSHSTIAYQGIGKINLT